MPSPSRLVLLGALMFFIGLVVFFPARVAYEWFVPPAVKLSGIDGSVWSGGAAAASASGIYVRNLRWQILPLQLLTGNLAYAIEANSGTGLIDGSIALGMSGTITATDLEGSLPLESLRSPLLPVQSTLQAVGSPGLRGNAHVEFAKLRIKNGIPVIADGVIEFSNLVVPGVSGSAIGGYRSEYHTEETGIVGSIEDTDGLIDIAGILRLANDGKYQFVAQVAAKANTPANVRQQMRLLGSANERGQYELRLEGQL